MGSTPGLYPFRIERALLELDVLELDSTLRRLFPPEPDSVALRFIGPEGQTQALTLDNSQGVLEGEGLGSFLGSFGSELLGISPLEEPGSYLVSTLPLMDTDGSTGGEGELEELLWRFQHSRFDTQYSGSLHSRSRQLSMRPGFEELLAQNIVLFTPFDYQLRTARYSLQRLRGRALLGDEVGLGKTIEAGLIALEYIQRGLAERILVLTPPSLVEQWLEELHRKFLLDFTAYDDPRFRAADNGWQQFSKVVASLDTAKRVPHSDKILEQHYDLVIVDEAHRLKNRNTQAWKFANALSKRYLLLLTATPVQNDLEELYNLVTLLRPGQLGSPSQFKRRYLVRGDSRQPQNVTELRKLSAEVMIRNRRADVQIQLPPRTAETLVLEMSSSEREMYRRLSEWVSQEYRAGRISKLLLKTLQQQAGSSPHALFSTLETLQRRGHLEDGGGIELKERAGKLQEENDLGTKAGSLVELLSGIPEKTIVFTAFQNTLEHLGRCLRDAGLSVAEFHGQMGRAQKDEAVRSFAEESQILLSTESGGEGRNLQVCHTLVNYDLPWNPMRIEQRIGRLHRIGQKHEVTIYNLSLSGTVESELLDVLDRKINLFELVVGELDMILGELKPDREFEDVVMDIWAGSSSGRSADEGFEELGEQLVEARQRYESAVEYDSELFGEELRVGKEE
jgi:SNF2 family DNA or RNA helicase